MFNQEFLTNLAQSLANACYLTCDTYSEGGENFIDFHLINFAAPTKKAYKAIIDGFKALEINKHEYSIHVSYDSSGFEYWMKNMQETQYGHLVVNLNEGFTMDNYTELLDYFMLATLKMFEIQESCNLFVECLQAAQDFTKAKKMLNRLTFV